MAKKKYDITKHKFDGKNGKILIGIPRERIYIPAFVDNRDGILTALAHAKRGSQYYQHEGHRVDNNRDSICKYFLEAHGEPEWLLMLDSDMEHPLDIGIRLSAWEKPIVGGLYFHRGHSHDPFMFSKGDVSVGSDLFGRARQNWLPMRDEVYSFLQEARIPHRDGAVVVGDPGTVGLIECDAVATGAMLIHRSVLEHMEPPWFEYRPGGNSEDLVFCMEAKDDYGIPIHCDMSTISGHFAWQPMGFVQFKTMYEGRGINLSLYTMPEIAKYFAEFFGIAEEKALQELKEGNAHMTASYWQSKNPQTSEEVRTFYEDAHTGRLYVVELIHWNASDTFDAFKKQLIGLRNKKVYELGTGIGSMAIQLALQHNNVITAEVNDTLRKFAEFRWNKLLGLLGHKTGEIEFTVDNWKELEDESMDAVIAFDVLEHLAKEDCKEFVLRVGKILKIGGQLVYHANWHQQDLYPSHFNYEEEWSGWLEEAGLNPISPISAMKFKN